MKNQKFNLKSELYESSFMCETGYNFKDYSYNDLWRATLEQEHLFIYDTVP